MFRSASNAPGVDGVVFGSAQGLVATPPDAVGKIQTTIGPVTVMRAGGVVARVDVGEFVYQGDAIATGADGAVGIIFADGTVFNLSSDARAVLNEFAYDPNGNSNSALLSLAQGKFAFIAGKVAKTGGLRIDTPFASIRGSARDRGVGVLTLAALTFAAIEESQAASRHDAFLDDGTITYKDLPHGTFEIVTRDGRVIMADDPGETIVVDPTGSVTRIPNSSSRMAELQQAQHNAFATLSLGQEGGAAGGSGSPQFDIPVQLQPINFSPPRNDAPSDLVTTHITAASSGFIPELKPPEPKPPVPALGLGGFSMVTETFNTTGSTHLDTVSSGTLTFTDFKLTTVSATMASMTWSGGATPPSGLAEVLAGALSITTENADPVSGSIATTFGAADHNFDFLAANETLTIVYDVTATGNQGVSLTRPVTITITGTNDAPVLAADASGPHTVTEGLNTTGTFVFTDVDLTDHHTVSMSVTSATWSGGATLPSGVAAALAGALSATVSDGTGPGSGSVAVTFSAADSAFDFLAAGQTLKITYNVTLADNSGVSSSQPVTVTITGTNDAPTLEPVTGPTYTDTPAPDHFNAVAGTLVGADVDLPQTLTYGIVGGTADNALNGYNVSLTGTYGKLYVNSASGAYTLVPNDTTINALTVPTTENFIFTVSDGSLSAQQNFTVTINSAAPMVSISDGTPNPATEGTDPSISFTVTLSEPADQHTLVTYSTVNGSAVAGTDFTGATNATVIIPAGATTATITIPVVDNAIVEPPEAFTVVLSAAQLVSSNEALTITDATGAGTILDNDQSGISIADTSVTEGGNLVFTVSRTLDSEQSQTVNYAVSLGSAELGDLSGPLSGTVTFAPGELSKTITVATVGDNIDETNETVTVTLTNPQGASPEATPTLGDAVSTGTILDNDQSVISIADTSVTEGGNLVFTVSRTLDSEQSQTVNYAVSLGSAELGDLSGVLSGTVTFAPGELSKTITVATVGDNIDETNETVTVTLTNPQGASPEATPTLGDAVATGTILDNDQSVISIADTSVTEGGNLVFTVSRTLDSEQSQTVNYAVSLGSAELGDLSGPLSGTVTFAPGELSKTITVATVGDNISETDETVTVTLTNPQGASPEATPTLGDAVATGTILDNDQSGISIADTSVTEGGNLVFTVSRTLDSEQSQTVNYAVSLGSAELGDLSGPLSGTVTFAPGELSKTITVATVGDNIDETNETVTVTLTNPQGTSPEATPTLGDAVATGTILDNDQSVISIADTSVTEGGNLVFTVSRTLDSEQSQTVNYAVSLGSAELGDLSGVLSGTVTFAPGELSKTITVATVGDNIDETNETVTVTLTNPQGASPEATPTLGDAVATGTILDNDQSVISIADTSVTEGGNLVFTVSRTLDSEQSQTVNYAVSLGSAELGDLSGPLSGTVTFAPGELSKTITVATVGDNISETDETVTVTLTNPQGASPEATPTLGDAVATGTILDNDQSGISIADTSVTEGGNLVFTVSRTLDSEQSQTVNYAVSLGSAELGDLSGVLSGTVTFAPGELSKTITVATVGDNIDETNETVTVTLTNPQGTSPEATPTLGDAVATGTILDNDQSVISIADTSVTEGGNLVFTVSRTLDSEQSQTVNYAVSLGSAELGDLSGVLSGTVTFAPGELSKTITVATVGDNIDETNETVTVTLTNPQGASPEATPTLGDAVSTGTILDNDQSVISIADTSVTEGGNLVFTVSRTLDSEQSQTVNYAVSLGSAELGDLSGPLSGTVTFAPGELSKTITVATVGDNIDETNETVTVTLTNPQGASPEATPTLGDAVSTGTILDNDQSVISIADTSVTEGGNLVFTVSRTLDSEQSQTVNYAVSLGSAELGDLSGVLSGTVTFAPGELSKTITVATVDDSIGETDETVTVTLTNPQGASPEATPTLGDAVATGTILDNDVDPNDKDDQATGPSPNGALFGGIWRGTGGNDTISPGNQAQIIYGGAGNDSISGDNGGEGGIFGGSGNDTIAGGTAKDLIYGGSGNDSLNGLNGSDILIGGYGADTLTGGLANDIFKYLSLNDGGDHITDFSGDVLEFTVTASRFVIGDGDTTVENFTIGNNAAINLPGTEVGVKTDASVTTATVQSTIDGYASITTGALFIFLNSDVGHAQVYYDPNPSVAGGAILVTDLDNLTTLASISTFSAANFAFGTDVAPAGVSGQPINLGLTASPANQGQLATVTVANVPSGWVLNGGTQLPDGSWTIETTDVSSLTITSPVNYQGAVHLDVAVSWAQSDGSAVIMTFADNVEAYAPGNPIFAISEDDNLTGSSGDDLFVLAQPIGQDVVYNFDAAHDKIDLIAFASMTSYADVQANLANDASGQAVLTLGDGMTITFAGVDAGALGENNFVFDQEPITHNAGTMVVSDGAMLPLSGIINNTGTIALNSVGAETELELIQHGITLQGGGQLTLSDSAGNAIFGTDPGVTLTNVDNTISGAGQIGEGQMTLVNSGTIIANGTHALIIDTGSNVVINSGTLEATGSGGLIVNSDIANSGLIWAYGGNITINGVVTGSGNALISGAATLEFAVASSVNVTFAGDNFGTLMLDNPIAYTGQIFGFTGTSPQNSDVIDLKGITFDADTSWVYYDNAGSNTGGTLTIFETINGTTTAVDSITFANGDYTTTDFNLTSDGHGGTLISDPPTSPTPDATVTSVVETTTPTATETAGSQTDVSAATVDGTMVARTTAVLEPDGDKTTNVTVNGNGAVAHTARIVSGPGSLMVNPGAAPEFTSLSHGVSGNLTDNRTVEVSNAPELGRTAPSRGRGAVNALEGQIAIASVMLVLEYLTENFKLASDANAGTLIADPPASPDAEVAAVSETRSIKVADTADTTPVAADDGTVAALDAAITPDGGMPDLMISSLPSDFALPESEGHEPPVHNDTIALAHSEYADHRLHGSGKEHTTALNVAAANSAEGHTAAKSPVAVSSHTLALDGDWTTASSSSNDSISITSNDANGGDAARIHSAIAGHSSTIDTVGTTISDGVSSSLQGATSGHLNDQPHFENATPSTLQSLESPTQAASLAADIPPVTAVEDADGGHAAHTHGAAAEHSFDTPATTIADSGAPGLRGEPPGHVNGQPEQLGNADPGNNGLGHQFRELPNQAASHAAEDIPTVTAVEDANKGHAADSHGAAVEHSSTGDTPATTTADLHAPGLRGEPPGHVNGQPEQLGNADPGNNGLGHQFREFPNQAASHAAENVPPVTAVEDANKGHAAHNQGAAAEHSSTGDTPATTIADLHAPGLRGEPPGHANDQPQLGNANNGLGHQSHELPSQAAAPAAEDIPPVAAVEDAKGGRADHSHGAAAEHSPTIDTPATTIANSDAPGVRGEPPGHVNDQPQLGNADPGNNGLGHQARELPSQAAAHAVEDIPTVTAVEDTNGGRADHSHAAAAKDSSTIDTAGAAVAHTDSSGSQGAAPGEMNDQFHFAYTNPDTSQSTELPSQAASHPAVEIPASTTDNSDLGHGNDFNPAALSIAVENAKGDDAAHTHGAAAKDSSTIDTTGAAVAHTDSSGSQGAASEHGNDQFHFANANPGNNGLGHQSLELPSQAASPAAVDIPPATTELAQILDDILTQAAQAPLDTVTAPGQNHELPWSNAHQDKPSNDFIIHA